MDNRRMSDDEEYQLSETEISSDTYAASPRPTSFADRIKRKNILMAIGIIIIILAVYKVAETLFFPVGVKKERVVKEQPKVAEPDERPVVRSPASTEVADNRLIALERTSADASARLEKLETGLSGINATMSEIEGKLANLNNTLQILSNEIAQQQTQISAFEATRRKPSPTIKQKRTVIPAESYYLQAVVPGRAWLKRKSGATATVSVGNRLPGYGEIESIDPELGVVRTSSGRDITYGSEDR